MTMTKKNQSVNGFAALLLLLAVVLGCSTGGGNETQKANKLVDEGNTAIEEARKNVTEGEALKKKMLVMKVSKLEEAHGVAKDSIAAYEKAEAKCKEAAAKYDEAGRLKLNDKFKEYLALKVKEYNKRAELMQMAKSVPQALIDSESRDDWLTQANLINKKVTQLAKEADDLSNQAEQIQKDNPNIFKA